MIFPHIAQPDQRAMRSGIHIFHRFGGCVIAAMALLSAACKPSSSSKPAAAETESDPVAIHIGKREIRLSELQAEIDLLAAKRHPAAASLDAFLAPAVERLVALEKARELGLDKDAELRRQSENLLIGRLRESEIETKLREAAITDEEIQDYFQRNQKQYTRPAQLHLALLFLSAYDGAGDEARSTVRRRMEEARAIALKLPQETRGFGEHAMTYSEEATSRFKGGDIGWMEAGKSSSRWPDAVVKAGFALQNNGDVSDIIETPDGFYLLKKIDARDAAVRSLDGRLRSTLESAMLKEKRSAIEAGLKQQWDESLNVRIRKELLGSLRFHSSKDKAESSVPLPAGP